MPRAVPIVVAEGAAVRAQGRGDAVAADRSDDLRRAHRIGMIAAARVTDRRDVVDVDAETQFSGQDYFRLPGLVTGIAASSGGTSSSA